MTENTVYYFSNTTTMLTLRHDIGDQIKGIKIRFTNEDGEEVEYEDTKEVGEQMTDPKVIRRGLNMVYKNLKFNGKVYNMIIDGVVDGQLDMLNVTASVQQVGEAGVVELEEPKYTIELIF